MVFNWNYRALPGGEPSIWLFQIVLIAITPIIDLFLLASLPFGAWNAVMPVRHHIPCDGRAARHARVYFGTRANPARLAHLTNAPNYRPMLSYCVWKESSALSKAPGSVGANSNAQRARGCERIDFSDPRIVQVCSCANAEMFAPNNVTHLIKQFRFVCRLRWR